MTSTLGPTLLGVLLVAALCVGEVRAGGAAGDDGVARAGAASHAVEDGTDDACAESAAALLQKRYEGARDIGARFTQVTRQAGAVPFAPVTSRGTLLLAKPGKLRWSYEEPEPSLVVSDGETLWIYDPAAREVQRMSVGGDYLSGAAIQFLLGEGDIFREFEVEAIACDAAAAELELRPRKPASYERIGVVVDRATGALIRSRMVDLLGTIVEVDLFDLTVNQDPAPEMFRFEPPDGIRMIEVQP